MATSPASLSSEELTNLSNLFNGAADTLQKYLESAAGTADTNFMALSSLVIDLNNQADTIGVMKLSLAVNKGQQAIGVIKNTTQQLQEAIDTRGEITRDLEIVKDLVAFGAAIVAKDPGSIISSGTDLYNTLKPVVSGQRPSSST